MTSSLGISVVICAHTQKRFHETCAAVESVRAQSLPSQEIIVVVDHNPALQASLGGALPDVTVVANREAQGLSGGKNTGVAVSHGEIVAFLDDDAAADQDWLKYFADSYTDPAVIGVGGRTLPNWLAPRPTWFPDEFAWVVGAAYRGMPETPRPGAQPARRERLVPPVRVRDRGRVPERDRPVRGQAAARLRGDRVLHQAEPALPGRRLPVRQPRGDLARRAGRALPVQLLPVPLLRRGPVQGAGHGQRGGSRRAGHRAAVHHPGAAQRGGAGAG